MDSKYHDLNVQFSTATPALIARLLDCEYLYIGISQTANIDAFNFAKAENNTDKKLSKEDRRLIRQNLISLLTPPTQDTLLELLAKSQQLRSVRTVHPSLLQPRLFTRLNLTCSDPQIASLFFREFKSNLLSFDVVGFEALTYEALSFAFETELPIDLISVDITRPTEFRPSSKQCSMALKRSLRVELNTASLFKLGSLPSIAHAGIATVLTQLNTVCRFHFSRLLILSSDAISEWEVRRPLAVASIVRVLGSASPRAILALQQHNPHLVLCHGLVRTRTSHGAATLLRLLADPKVESVSYAPPNNAIHEAGDVEPKPKRHKHDT